MAHPYNDKGFRHYLKFYDFNMDWYEICEPIGFDAAKYVKKQLPNRWTRDVEYFAIEGLTFADTSGKRLSSPRVCNPQGDLSEFMDYGLLYLLENRRIRGSEMKVGYKISRNGVDFKEFELDNRGDDITDGETYYTAKLIEIGLVADHFRNLKNTFNAFSNKNWKDETITPINSFNYLVKATGSRNTNIIKSTGETQLCQAFIFNSPGSAPVFINKIKNIIQSDIESALSWLEDESRLNFVGDTYEPDPSQFAILRARKNIKSLKITIKLNLELFRYSQNFAENDRNVFRLYLFKSDGASFRDSFPGITNSIWVSDVFGTETGVYSQSVSETIDLTLNDIVIGGKVYFAFSFNSNSALPIYALNYLDSEISMLSEEVGLNTVSTAVTYYDLITQGIKYTNTLPLLINDSVLETKFKRQAIFNRNLINKTNELYTTNENLHKSLQEYCADVEISTQNVQIRQNEGFYENIEIASFLVIPSEDYNEPYNETYLINNFGWGYKNFEQDRSAENTSLGVHTYSEWLPRNQRSDNSKKIEIDLVRDFLEKQTVIDLELNKPKTSTEKDEKLFIEDMCELPPNTFNVFFSSLLMRWVSGKLEILNTNSEGETGDSIINWNKLGLQTGSIFEILESVNVGVYTVFSVSTNGTIITLTPNTPVSQYTGDATIKIRHNYVNVFWQTRTTEGFSIAPRDYSNLAYTIKRNMKYWYQYLASVMLYAKSDIQNSFFKNFGKLETQLDTETTPVIEDARILYSDLPKPLVEPIIIKAKIVAQYEDVVEYLENYRTKKGFVRIFTPNGKVVKVFPKMFEYNISTNEANIDGEKKYEDEFLKITIDGNIVNVNDAPYDIQGVAEWFITKNDFIQLYDKKSNPLSNYYRYDFVLLNGVKYNSITELVTQLNTVVWT